ncbi:unnamed protein product [marine sediment metagenome]|uniref:Uncharacterized protein n=1 Tax=marine sediment metagenome TaxID=412755 RepID=X1QZI5_9ZZZZ
MLADTIIARIIANFLKAGSGRRAFDEKLTDLGDDTAHNGMKIIAKNPISPMGPY